MKKNKDIQVTEVSLLVSLADIIDRLAVVRQKYVDTHLRFATDVYEKGSDEMFEQGGCLDLYPEQVRLINGLMETQLENLERIKKTLERPN